MLHLLNREMRQSSGLGVVFSQAIASRLGIGASDLECLDIVALRNDVTAGELAFATGLTTGAVTGVLDRLEQAGFVRRERDAKDRRKVRVRLEPGTLAKAMPYYRSLERTMKKLLTAYSDAEIALLLGLLQPHPRGNGQRDREAAGRPALKHGTRRPRSPRRAAAAAGRRRRRPPRG